MKRGESLASSAVEAGVIETEAKRPRATGGLDDGGQLSAELTTTSHEGSKRQKCPYLDTVNRQFLDFDQLKMCSVTLTNMNVYACLVCGKFFQGRSKSTPAYTHSVQCGHFVFMNLHDGRTFCLPDSYEVVDQSLEDVKKCLSPTFTTQAIAVLNGNTSLARDVYGVSYLPGFVGLNNLKHTDYVNVALHALSHVTPFRDFFLDPRNVAAISRHAVCRELGAVLGKLWSDANFKSVISPMEFLQEISTSSKKRFNVGQPSEVVDFVVWLLGEVHRGLGGSSKKSSVVHDCFQGVVEVTTRKQAIVTSSDREGGGGTRSERDSEWVESTIQVPFTFLALDIPPTPLFRDSTGGLIIPQLPLFEILKKFDGSTWTDTVDASGVLVRKRYRLVRLPKYLILHLVRFTRNNFTTEKNQTIITFPVKNLELRDYLPALPSEGDVPDKDMVPTKYDLMANICHDSSASQDLQAIGTSANAATGSKGKNARPTAAASASAAAGSYRCHIQSKATGQWFEVQDLHVQETMPQLIGLSESYMLVYERKDLH